MVTLALTVIVLLTVDPEVGEVMLTISLLSCADACGGRTSMSLSVRNKAIARADGIRSERVFVIIVLPAKGWGCVAALNLRIATARRRP